MLALKTDSKEERRHTPRKNCRLPVRVRVSGDAWYDAFLLDSRDIAPNGIFVRCDLLFPLGQRVDVEFRGRAGERPIRRSGRIVRVSGRNLGDVAGFVVGDFGLREEDLRSIGFDLSQQN